MRAAEVEAYEQTENHNAGKESPDGSIKRLILPPEADKLICLPLNVHISKPLQATQTACPILVRQMMLHTAYYVVDGSRKVFSLSTIETCRAVERAGGSDARASGKMQRMLFPILPPPVGNGNRAKASIRKEKEEKRAQKACKKENQATSHGESTREGK